MKSTITSEFDGKEGAYKIMLEEAHLNGNPIIKAIFDSAWKMSEQNILATVTPREAYVELIKRASGKGTWDSNPWVFVYDFELIK